MFSFAGMAKEMMAAAPAVVVLYDRVIILVIATRKAETLLSVRFPAWFGVRAGIRRSVSLLAIAGRLAA